MRMIPSEMIVDCVVVSRIARSLTLFLSLSLSSFTFKRLALARPAQMASAAAVDRLWSTGIDFQHHLKV